MEKHLKGVGNQPNQTPSQKNAKHKIHCGLPWFPSLEAEKGPGSRVFIPSKPKTKNGSRVSFPRSGNTYTYIYIYISKKKEEIGREMGKKIKEERK